ncbi:MAG: FAD-dependent oxidoreductase, partial [Gordonia sp. (in: high G+C Gram-positive bacteria)]|uniref:FAD-dependent oxidoreductase n=1 Tax=Gordonia sp. (in: high G+C Gram-positive bacteria) TaxID=84139 RepID=UPI003BB6F195
MSGRVAVIGGGVSGLTAAYALRSALGAAVDLDVWEAAERPGGLLCTRTVDSGATDGVAMDVGAEAFIVRRREAIELVRQLGLADQVVAPGPLRPAIWSGERLHPLPAPAVMGIPCTAAALGDLIDAQTRVHIETEPQRPWTLPRTGLSVGELVRDRFGAQVVARSVDPMLGGVYSARADDLGLSESVGGLAKAIAEGAPSLTAAVTAVSAAAASVDGPVFGALRGGYRTLVDALAAASGATIHTGAPVVAIDRQTSDYRVVTADDAVRYDAVVVAVPPWSASELLAGVAPETASLLADVRPAGSAVVGCVLAPGTVLPAHSGILVASDADLAMKAVTLSTQKWP